MVQIRRTSHCFCSWFLSSFFVSVKETDNCLRNILNRNHVIYRPKFDGLSGHAKDNARLLILGESVRSLLMHGQESLCSIGPHSCEEHANSTAPGTARDGLK